MLKTNKSLAKRVRFTAKKKLKRAKANTGHILGKKTRKRKRKLRKGGLVSKPELKQARRMLPYG